MLSCEDVHVEQNLMHNEPPSSPSCMSCMALWFHQGLNAPMSKEFEYIARSSSTGVFASRTRSLAGHVAPAPVRTCWREVFQHSPPVPRHWTASPSKHPSSREARKRVRPLSPARKLQRSPTTDCSRGVSARRWMSWSLQASCCPCGKDPMYCGVDEGVDVPASG